MAISNAAKLATTVVTIAQLKFKQAIKNPDNEDRLPPVSVEVSAQLFSSIDAVLQQNTSANVQKCTEWIMKHIAPSKARIALLGDYLTAVSKSIVVDQSAPGGAGKAARNRMDLLRIVNDVLHADKLHHHNSTKQGVFGDVCGGFVAQLIERAAEFMTEKNTPLENELIAIVNSWALNHLASPDCLKLCRERADNALVVAQGGTPVQERNYLLPEYHGDKTAPWHDLPASYMLEPMIKLRDPRKDSIDPREIRIQKLDKRPVSQHVRNLLDEFFENIDLKYRPTGDNPTGETAKYKLSLDPLGQIIKQDKETGETATVANGYGWSMKFCQDLRKYGVPENIKIAREDVQRMEEDVPRRRRSPSIDADHRRGRRQYSRGRSASRNRSVSTYDSHRSNSRSLSRGMTQDRHHVAPNTTRRGSSDYGRQHESLGPDQSRQPPRLQHRDESQHGSQRGRSGGQNRSAQSSPSNQQYQNPPTPHQNYGQLPFNAPQLGQFPPGRFPMPMPPFGAPPPDYQGAGAFVPPRPPNYAGPWPPRAPNMNVPPNGPQYSSQYGNNYNNVPYNQNQSGFQGGRGYGSPQRGGYNANRGGWRGNGRGGRYQG